MTSDRRNLQDSTVEAVPRLIGDENGRMLGPADQSDRLRLSLANCLFRASRTVQIHDLNNRATQTVLSKLVEVLSRLTEAEGRVTVTVATDLLLINDVRVIVDPQNSGPVLYLIDMMKKRKVEGIDFTSEVTASELGMFLQLFFGELAEEDAFGELSRKLINAEIKNIRLTEWMERVQHLTEAKVERREIREESNKVMSRAILFMGEVLRSIEQKRPIQLPKAHRLAQQMVDVIQADESILLGLASIKDYDEYTFAHSVNVSVLSMLIADRMGLHKDHITQIGVAGLLHDIGKMHVPQLVLNKPGALAADEWELMKRHSMLGVIELSRIRSLRAVADPLFVALQHHLYYNGGGYPSKPGGWELHPYTHIVAVADVYDAMTTPRIYRKHTMAPDRTLRFIHHKSGEFFDPHVVKVFIKAMGVYPVGTVVELDTGERAVVLRQNDKTRLMHRPVVALLHEDGPVDVPVDLAERVDDSMTYRRTVVRSVHDKLSEAQKASCFLMT